MMGEDLTETCTAIESCNYDSTDMDHMVQIDTLIAKMQETSKRFGNTCVYIRRGGLSWGAVALNRRDDDKKNGMFDLQAQHDRDMVERVEQIQRLVTDNERLRAENERLTDELCKWRSAIQELTPGGSEFMSVDAVRNYAKMQKKETFDAHMGAAKARKELAQAEAQLAVAVGVLENFEITGPDGDGFYWLVLHGKGATGKGAINLGSDTRPKIVTQVLRFLEEDRKNALAAYHAEPVAQSGGVNEPHSTTDE